MQLDSLVIVLVYNMMLKDLDQVDAKKLSGHKILHTVLPGSIQDAFRTQLTHILSAHHGEAPYLFSDKAILCTTHSAEGKLVSINCY